MATLSWPATGDSRGSALLVHGMTSLAEDWWRIGPALAARGWDVTAVDQPGHGDSGPLGGPVTVHRLGATLLGAAESPRLVIGHSLGVVSVLAALRQAPGWAGLVVLEDPPSDFDPSGTTMRAMAAVLRHDADLARRAPDQLSRRIAADCPGWAPEDVQWAVRGLARMDVAGYLAFLDALGPDRVPDIPDWVLHARPLPYVLAARGPADFLHGGSALRGVARSRLQEQLPSDHFVEIDGGHALHRDNPAGWLAAVDEITRGR